MGVHRRPYRPCQPATCIDERPIRIFAARYPTQAAENITLFVSE